MNADTTGIVDLADNGSWDSSDFGPVWYPAVPVDWRPYFYGHWRYLAPWGWTWVGAEPWGFAPFHYGRWAEIGSRWGWIPGPRIVRPVYAPALVVFAGGAQFASSLGYPAGFGITAWFPLGPREPYLPPYGGSTLYRNRLNVSNLFNPDEREVRRSYNQPAVNVFAGAGGANATYRNRAASIAVPQSSFGLVSVNRSTLRLPGDALAAAPLLGGSPVPSARVTPGYRRATALPPVLSRPVQSDVDGTAVGRPAVLAGMSGNAAILYRSPLSQSTLTQTAGARSPSSRGAGISEGNRTGSLPAGEGRSPNGRPVPLTSPRSGPVPSPAREGEATRTSAPAAGDPTSPRH